MNDANLGGRTLDEALSLLESEKKTILAVDDKPELLTSVVDMIRDLYNVMAVTSAKAALRAIQKQTPSLFLLDIEMPYIDGFELADMLRKQTRFANTPIIFLTAKNTRDDVFTAIKHGGNDYILKPVDKELLITKIQKYIK